MSAAKRSHVMNIISAYSGKDSTIAIPRVYVELTGDFNRAAILNQILYWADRTKDPDGWFYKSYSDWEAELGLSQYQVKRAIEGDKRSKNNDQALANLGVETTLRKAPNGAPTVHYRVNESVFVEHLTAAIDRLKSRHQPARPIINNVDKRQSTMSTMDCEQSQQSINTESTTESTQKDIAAVEPPRATKGQTQKRDRLFDGVAYICFGIDVKSELVQDELKAASSRIGKIVSWLKKLGETPEPDELWSFSKWYRTKYPGVSMPRDKAKFAEHFAAFRSEATAEPAAAYHKPANIQKANLTEEERVEALRVVQEARPIFKVTPIITGLGEIANG